MPSWLVAVLVPPPLSERIEAFRATRQVRESPPHVTLKARAGLGDGLAWLESVQEVARGSPPLELSISGPRTFGRKVVYLKASGNGLRSTHLRLMDALKPEARFGYEGANFTPHLSLALARRGMDLGDVLANAKQAFDDLSDSPFTFTATSLWVMRKAGPGALYLPWKELEMRDQSVPNP